MGKGDKRSKKGKITIGSYGVKRRATGTKIAVTNPGAKAAPAKEKKVAVKKAAPKKEAVKKEAAPKAAPKAKASKKKEE
jgi:ribosomal small subunit protein bTHX